MLNYIHWDVSPEIFEIGTFAVRWYGLLFALGFILAQQVLIKIWKGEGRPESEVETLTIYMVVATVVGARLGHCLFYEPDYYLSNPLEILKIWKGGLASHGATVGILLALYLYSRKKADQSYLYVLDRLVIVIALAGGCIRFGNLMNSEIIGEPSTVPWAFVFERIDQLPRHPAQLYESISSFLLFFFLYWLYNRKKEKTPEGLIFSIFLIVLFGLRFCYEFLKENQVDFEDSMALNMGQILSIPLVMVGIGLLFWVMSRKGNPKTDQL